MTYQDKKTYIFAHNTVIINLTPQVAGANQGEPGK